MNHIRQSLASGAAWMLLLRLADRSVGLISTLILARILVPADFGLVAMAMSIVGALEVMTAFNFDLALVQRRNAERRHYDSAWTLNVLFAIGSAALLALMAGSIAEFYRERRVEAVVLWLAGYVALQGFTNVGVVEFQKELQFHKEFILGVAKKLVGFAVAIPLAIVLRSYWALIAGMMATVATRVVLSYLMHSYRPRFSVAGCRDLMQFSSWLLINNVLAFLVQRSADFFIGRYAGPQSLGTYNVAYEISNLPTTELVFPVARAAFPAYSRMSRETGELARGYVDLLSVILVLIVPAGIGIAVIADPLVRILLGEKWVEAIPLIQILAIFGLLRASISNSSSVFLALGRPDLMVALTTFQVVLLGAGFLIFVPSGGAIYAAYVALSAACVQVPLVLYLLMRSLRFRFKDLLDIGWRPLLSGTAMALGVLLADSHLTSASPIVKLLCLVPLGAIVYGSLLLALWRIVGCPNSGEALIVAQARRWVQRAVPN